MAGAIITSASPRISHAKPTLNNVSLLTFDSLSEEYRAYSALSASHFSRDLLLYSHYSSRFVESLPNNRCVLNPILPQQSEQSFCLPRLKADEQPPGGLRVEEDVLHIFGYLLRNFHCTGVKLPVPV